MRISDWSSDVCSSDLLSGANITKAAGAEDSSVTINTIMSQMAGSASQAKAFDQALKDLKERGLSSSLLQQIAEAGVERDRTRAEAGTSGAVRVNLGGRRSSKKNTKRQN